MSLINQMDSGAKRKGRLRIYTECLRLMSFDRVRHVHAVK